MQNGLKDASATVTFQRSLPDSTFVQKLAFLKIVSLGLLCFVLLLVIMVAVLYFRMDSEVKQPSQQEIEEIVRKKVQEKLMTSRRLKSDNLRVQWTLEHSESSGSTHTSLSGEISIQSTSQTSQSFEISENSQSEEELQQRKMPLCSIDELSQEEMKEDEFAEVSTHVQSLACSKESTRKRCYQHRRECDLLRKGIPGLQSKLTISRSGRQ